MVRKSKKSQRDENSEGLTGSAPVESGLSGGAIAGIVIAVVLAIIALLYGFYYLKCVKFKRCIKEKDNHFYVPKNFLQYLTRNYTKSSVEYGIGSGSL